MSVSDKLLVISAIFFDVHKLETINDALISTRLPGCQSDQRQRKESVSVKCVNQPNRLLLQTRQYRPYLARAPKYDLKGAMKDSKAEGGSVWNFIPERACMKEKD